MYNAVKEYESYIFFDVNDMTLTKLKRNSIEIVPFTTDAETPLVFGLSGFPAKTLLYQIEGTNNEGGKDFHIAAEVLMLNIIAKDNTSNATGALSGTAIRYWTPEDTITALQYPTVSPGAITGDKQVVLGFNRDVKLVTPDGISVMPGDTKPKGNPLQDGNVAITPDTTITGTRILTITFKQIGSAPTGFVAGDIIVLRLSYGEDGAYEAVFSLSFEKKGNSLLYNIE
jgi:hypothetical protein